MGVSLPLDMRNAHVCQREHMHEGLHRCGEMCGREWG